MTATDGGETTAAPRWQLPMFDWDEGLGAALGRALARSGPVDFAAGVRGGANGASRCPFVQADACAVAWHGGVSPCPPLLHTYALLRARPVKQMTRWEVGRLPDESLAAIWAKPDYVAFRERVRRFDFPPCTDCGASWPRATRRTASATRTRCAAIASGRAASCVAPEAERS